MNFLAHVYLSGEDMDLAIGNLIADRVKGKEIQGYPKPIQRGIHLHRKIDIFTDTHPRVRECRKFLFPQYRHYSGVIIDMYFDHFLALHWKRYHPIPLAEFSVSFYSILKEKSVDFPSRSLDFVSALIQYDWFSYYQTITGLQEILIQMDRRTTNSSKLSSSVVSLEENYSYFGEHFFSFMEDVISFSTSQHKNLKS